jgi:hypothetical protein
VSEVAAVAPKTMQAQAAGKALTGQTGNATENQDKTVKRSVNFSQVLRRGLSKTVEKEDKSETATATSATSAAAVLPASNTTQPNLAAVLSALLSTGAVTGTVAADNSAQTEPVALKADSAGQTTSTATAASGTESLPATGKTSAKAIAAAGVNQAADSETDPEEAVQEKSQEMILPTGGESAAQDGAAGALEAAGAAVAAGEVTAEESPKSTGGPGAKLKLDFSAFDAAFPEGWQALFGKEAAGSKTEKTAPLPATPAQDSVATGSRTVAGSQKTDGTRTPQAQLDLNLPALEGAVRTAGVHAQAQDAGTAQSGSNLSHTDKEVESGNARVSVRAAGSETWMLPTETKTAGVTVSTAGSAMPGQVFSRLNDLQQQMVVENFSKAALPGLQGNRETLTVDLNPPELGHVQVHVEKAANGNGVNAVVTIQDRTVGEYFQGQTETIRKTLEAAGITLGGLSVEIRQQFNQDAREKSASETGKNTGKAASADTGLAAVTAKKSGSWAASGLSRVEIMV